MAFVFAQETANDAEARSHEAQLDLARSLSATTASFVEGNAQAVHALSSAFRGEPEPSDELNRRIVDAVKLNPAWRSAAVIASDGSVIGSSVPTFVGVSLADRQYFQHVTSSGTPVVSGVLSSRLDGARLVVVAAPLTFEDGTVGAFAAELNRDYLRTKLLVELRAASSRIVLLDGEGQPVLDSESLPGEGDGEEVASARWAIAGDGAEGTAEIVLEGKENLLAFAPVGAAGWVTTISEPSDVAFAYARSIIEQRVVVLGVSLLLILGLAWITGGWLNSSYASLEAARVDAERARKQAEELAAARDEFLSIASHELRNPTAGIRGAAQLMQRRARAGSLTPESLRDYLDRLVDASERLSRLVTDLLDVSRLSRGQLALRLEIVDFAELVESAIRATDLEGHPVTVQRRDGPIHVCVDPLRIEEVIRNLLENAAKYSPAASPIEVAVDSDDAQGVARLRVTDQGIGIPPEEMNGLFQPFKRASNAAHASVEGLGLGLYVSRGLVEPHGGALWGESQGDGQGCTFVLTLPIVTPS